MKCTYSILTLALLLGFTPRSLANWAYVGNGESLIQSADVLAVGTITAFHATVVHDHIEYIADLLVSEVLAGEVSPSSHLTVIWVNQVGVVCPRLGHDLLIGIPSFFWLNAAGHHFVVPSPLSIRPLSEAHSLVSELSRVAAPTERIRVVIERARLAASTPAARHPLSPQD